MQPAKKILLICYSFPPFPGIGGRRWAKFSKHLVENNFEVFAIGALHRKGKESNWAKDVQNSKIHYFPIKTKFFSFFHDHQFNLVKKISYKLSKIYLKQTSKGNFYDKALASNDLFYEKAKELILKHDIKNLVVTIAPNRLVEVGMKLKREFPDLNFIVDIRDPWNICLDEWDHKYLNNQQKQHELAVELAAAKTADKVFSVCQIINDFYLSHYPEKKADYIFVPNGYDQEEMNIKIAKKQDSDKRYFVYTGILYDISIKLFEEFLQQIIFIKKNNPDLLNNTEFRFYIPEQTEFKKRVDTLSLNQYVKFYSLVPLAEAHAVIAGATACMLFLPPNFEFSLSTKFYEYVSFNKKVLLFSNPGEVGELINKHHLGYVMLPGKMQEPFKFALEELISGKELPKHTFNLEDYSVQSLTKKIIPYFK